MTDLAMQGIDVFMDTYVRLDEGTAVLLCAHRSCVRTTAWLYAALVLRGAVTDAQCFDHEDEPTERLIMDKLAWMRARPGVRRVAIVVCEPGGASFRELLAGAQGSRPERTPIFRISGRATGIFERGFGVSPLGHLTSPILPDDDGSEGDMSALTDEDVARLAEMTEEEVAALAESSDDEHDELASTWDEEGGFRVLA
jgi:hypothetical protein